MARHDWREIWLKILFELHPFNSFSLLAFLNDIFLALGIAAGCKITDSNIMFFLNQIGRNSIFKEVARFVLLHFLL